jgi:hypothetical protein
MSRKWQLAAAAFAVAIVLWIVGIPWYVPMLLILAALAIPLVAYMTLDSSQRARIRRMRGRGQIGR